MISDSVSLPSVAQTQMVRISIAKCISALWTILECRGHAKDPARAKVDIQFLFGWSEFFFARSVKTLVRSRLDISMVVRHNVDHYDGKSGGNYKEPTSGGAVSKETETDDAAGEITHGLRRNLERTMAAAAQMLDPKRVAWYDRMQPTAL